MVEVLKEILLTTNYELLGIKRDKSVSQMNSKWNDLMR